MSALLTLLPWTAGRLLRSPATAAVALALAACWALLLVLSPLGMTVGSERAIATIYELAFLSALAGGALALAPLQDSAWLLRRVDGARRLLVGCAMLFTGGLLGWMVGGLLPALLLTTLPISGALALGSLLGLAHLAALGALLVRAPMPSSLRPVALVLLAWLLPRALAPGELGPRDWLALCDLSRYWSAPADLDLASLARSAAAIAALLLAAVLIEAPARVKAAQLDLGPRASGSRPPR